MQPSNFDVQKLYFKVCDKTYKNKQSFKRHLDNIHHIEPPSCSYLLPDINDQDDCCFACERSFCNRTTYLHHLTFFHLDVLPELYQGVNCDNPSNQDISFKKYCADCQKVFLLKRLCQIHREKIHGVELPKYLPSVGDLNNHSELCDKTYSDVTTYRRHLVNVHKLIKSSTVRQWYKMNNETPVADRLNNHCNVCDIRYKTLDSYRHHMTRYHYIQFRLTKSQSGYVDLNEIPTIDEINNHCTSCDKVYKSRRAYRIHSNRIHNILLPRAIYKKAPLIHQDFIPDVDDKDNYCASCDIVYSSKASYFRRLTKIHQMNTKKDTKVI
ncbi:hypothetical protein EDC94DRAFT_606656 [Helicostylum pulchrum]|nr:hypothetical protein EDC94DRAFT_606656 [Helicostylum pulchrum]